MKLHYLSIPTFVSCGSHLLQGKQYRFLVMNRFGEDIESIFRTAGRFCNDTICYLALRIVSIHWISNQRADSEEHSSYVRIMPRQKPYLPSPSIKLRWLSGNRVPFLGNGHPWASRSICSCRTIGMCSLGRAILTMPIFTLWKSYLKIGPRNTTWKHGTWKHGNSLQ